MTAEGVASYLHFGARISDQILRSFEWGESPMTPWGRNFLLLTALTTEYYWLIGCTHFRCLSAVGMDADVGFLAVAEKAGHALNAIFSD